MTLPVYRSKREMRRAFRDGFGVYDDGQSSYSVRCQEARQRGRLPMSQAVRLVRALLLGEGVKRTIAEVRQALRETHDGEWHHTSKFGNRTPYYDPQAAVRALLAIENRQSKIENAAEAAE